MSSRVNEKNASSAPHKSQKRPNDSRPRSARDQAKRPTPSTTETVRVILPAEPPPLNPAAARVLLRILLKAYDQLANKDNPQRDVQRSGSRSTAGCPPRTSKTPSRHAAGSSPGPAR